MCDMLYRVCVRSGRTAWGASRGQEGTGLNVHRKTFVAFSGRVFEHFLVSLDNESIAFLVEACACIVMAHTRNDFFSGGLFC